MLVVSVSEFITLAAVVAAMTMVMSNAFQIQLHHRPLLAIFLSVVMLFVPKEWREYLLLVILLGMTATGFYHQVKPRDEDQSGVDNKEDN